LRADYVRARRETEYPFLLRIVAGSTVFCPAIVRALAASRFVDASGGTTFSVKHFDLMEIQSFTHVTIKSPRTGRLLIVRSVRDAMTVLTQYWSRRKSEKHTIACQACRDALDESGSVENARTAFVAAAREAGIHVTERTGSLLGPAPNAPPDRPEKPAGTL
jgi:hypothetical protein